MHPGQTISYTYNIKGWLTQINDPNTVSDQGALFGMKLFYNEQDINVGNEDLYNGNISGIKWQNTGALSTQSNPVGGLKAYSFAYDGINRLENGTYKEVLQNSWNDNNKYNEVLTYDRNGNIETLQRMGIRNNNIGLIDNLSYTYDGNRLKAVDDAITDITAGGFTDNGNYYTLIPEYTYDANGNMTSDVNKGVEGLTYNYMNLLISARRGLNECVEYLYNATGVKLQQKHSNRSTNYQFTTDFVTNFVYEDGQLAHVNTPEGRIVYNTNGTIRQEFNLKDHLGNVRVVYSVENGVVTTRQIDNYYPFGYNIKGLSVNKYATTRPNEYLYNGKMMQDEMGLNWLDYGARMYDAILGRFHCVDPMTEFSPDINPYRYAFNNPLKFIDPDGMYENVYEMVQDAWNSTNPNQNKMFSYENGNLTGEKKIDPASFPKANNVGEYLSNAISKLIPGQIITGLDMKNFIAPTDKPGEKEMGEILDNIKCFNIVQEGSSIKLVINLNNGKVIKKEIKASEDNTLKLVINSGKSALILEKINANTVELSVENISLSIVTADYLPNIPVPLSIIGAKINKDTLTLSVGIPLKDQELKLPEKLRKK